MKIFIVVLIAATVIGGFVGAELTYTNFPITGEIIGGVGTFSILMGLGAFFSAQGRKKSEKGLPQKMREVFDRMFGQSSVQSQPAVKPRKPEPEAESRASVQFQFLSAAGTLLSIQLLPRYAQARKAFPAIMTNKIASGYVFGFHDALLERLGLYTPANKESAQALIEKSYKHLFGQQAGCSLFSMSLNSQENAEFQKGRMNGGNEVIAYLEGKIPPLGLGRIVNMGLEA
jgi:hypothetical protein